MQALQAMTISQARRTLAAVIDATARGPVVIHRRNQAVAVLLSMAEYERLMQPNTAAFQGFCDAVGERAATAGMTEDRLAALLHDSKTSDQPAAPDRPAEDRPAWDEAWSAEADRREDRIARGESSWVSSQEAIDRLRDGAV